MVICSGIPRCNYRRVRVPEKPGKRGRAVDLEPAAQLMAQSIEPQGVTILVQETTLLGDHEQSVSAIHAPLRGEGALPRDNVTADTSHMYNNVSNEHTLNLYRVDSLSKKFSVPFMHGVILDGPQGESVRFRSIFDDGAMVNVIDKPMFMKTAARLTQLAPSLRTLRMADGHLVASMGVWTGNITIGSAKCESSFEVFDSGGAWALLVGKPLLEQLKATHDYAMDTITIPQGDTSITISNQYTDVHSAAAKLLAGLTIDIKQRTNSVGDSLSPSRQVPHMRTPVHKHLDQPKPIDAMPSLIKPDAANEVLEGHVPVDIVWNDELPYANFTGDWQSPLREVSSAPTSDSSTHNSDISWDSERPGLSEHWSSVWTLDNVAGGDKSDPGAAQPELTKIFDPSILTRRSEPFKPERVKAIIEEITIGNDLQQHEVDEVKHLLAEFADCFALSMSEVTIVEGAAHRLDIPRDKKFRTKINQRPQSPPQKIFFNGVIEKMLEADIIEPIPYQDVKCCGATTLAKKAHEGGGLTLEELQHRVNDQCIAAGFPSAFENLPPRNIVPGDTSTTPLKEQNKWRVCQDFAELNKVTQVPPMPQGDIRAKQQRLSGHRWVNVFDFASGFYACEIKPEDRPYVCFYVEGRGYFAYKRMPFGLTGAPSTFAQMTANALGNLTGTLIELFVDDGGMAGDEFKIVMNNLRTLFIRVREKGLSLSAVKSQLFMSEATFAGGRVGREGIKPDLTKLTCIADWPVPHDLQNLGSFLGVAGYFRSLIKGYAAMAQPLTDLAQRLEGPKLKGKAAYNRAMKGFTLVGHWTKNHDRAFLRLKIALTCEPVLKGPKYDGTPFIVTTDGCKYGFAG